MATKPLIEIAQMFQLDGRVRDVTPFGGGHINDTFVSSVDSGSGSGTIRYLHQRINQGVFAEPEKVMDNFVRITSHVRTKIVEEGGDPLRETLTLVPTNKGAWVLRDDQGGYWRTLLFVENTTAHDQAINPRVAFEAARSFGTFQRRLCDLPPPRLHETIVDFHNTPHRYKQLRDALDKDPKKRAASVAEECEFAFSHEKEAGILAGLAVDDLIPERVTHNDAKLNNVLLDNNTQKGVCVIDLDTVMPGLSLYDFGDLCRSATLSTAEDERDTSKVTFRLDIFEALVEGYLEAARNFLCSLEIEHLCMAARAITVEQGVRFLTDFVLGDTYYKTNRDNQNLDRCRTQFALVKSMDHHAGDMRHIVRRSLA